jgi:hypothetical protein
MKNRPDTTPGTHCNMENRQAKTKKTRRKRSNIEEKDMQLNEKAESI